MSDERPRPEYGEYASPEEQRAAIKQPAEYYPVTDAAPQVADASPAPVAAEPGRRHPRTVDVVFTVLLLGWGLYEVVNAVLNSAQFARIPGMTFAQAGVVVPDDAVPLWVGSLIAAAYVLVWIIAAVLSVLSLRRGRLSFWIPLAAGAFINIAAVLTLMLIVLPQLDLSSLLPTPGATASLTPGQGSIDS